MPSMDSGVGSSGDSRSDRSIQVRRQRRFELSLNRSMAFLAGIAPESRAVIRQIEPIGRHRQTKTPESNPKEAPSRSLTTAATAKPMRTETPASL